MWVRKEMPARGDRLDEGSVPWEVPDGVLNFRDTPLLVAVDPYGDTVFNRFQIERQLPREVTYLRQQLSHAGAVEMLDELERLMALATERVHRYLWFVGD
ncbi:hypothetical protein GCM10023317_53860 [Actinopolymorpha pittospori]|uniref:Uncharacterized protein n=2 Tax=Actinopolymorpha pittospori TaxID=648752 RepID=A0A927MYJ5_9ACTN|nr:hypothetical protein [Actinopolymorpha pittospori]